MGDIRNKIAKIERGIAEKAAGEAWLRLAPTRPAQQHTPAPAPQCACGHTCYEATLWSLPVGRFDPPKLCCRDCAPEEFKADLIRAEEQRQCTTPSR